MAMTQVPERDGVPVILVFRLYTDDPRLCVRVFDRGRAYGCYYGTNNEVNLARFFTSVDQMGRDIVAVVPSGVSGTCYVVTRLRDKNTEATL